MVNNSNLKPEVDQFSEFDIEIAFDRTKPARERAPRGLHLTELSCMRVRGVQAPAEGDALPIAPHEAASQRGEGGRCAAREARPTFVLVSPERKLEARLGVPSVGGGQQPLARRRRVPLQPVRPLADRHACNDIGPH